MNNAFIAVLHFTVTTSLTMSITHTLNYCETACSL